MSSGYWQKWWLLFFGQVSCGLLVLRLAINEVRRVKEGGLLILALPCCSFCKPCPPQRFGLPCLSICSRKKNNWFSEFVAQESRHSPKESAVSKWKCGISISCLWQSVSSKNHVASCSGHGLGSPDFDWTASTINSGMASQLWVAYQIFWGREVSSVELFAFPHVLEVYKGAIWHGLYYFYQSTPKRQWLWSNDQELLNRIVACAGTMPPGTMRNFQGESLTKRRKGPEGKVSWSGNGQVLTASQLFGGNPFVFAFIVDIHVCHACFFSSKWNSKGLCWSFWGSHC